MLSVKLNKLVGIEIKISLVFANYKLSINQPVKRHTFFLFLSVANMFTLQS